MPGLCNQIKDTTCYFESNNPREETRYKHERSGSLPRGSIACSQDFVLSDGENMGLGVLIQAPGFQHH